MSLSRPLGLALLLSSLTSFHALAQWAPVDSGTSNNLRGVRLLESGVAYAVGEAGTILKSSDSGATWSALVSGTARALYDLHFFNDAEGVAVGDNGLILRTTDGGTSWSAVTSGVRDGLRSVSFSGANGISGGLSQIILVSSDSGATWNVSQSGFFGGGFFGAQMLSATLGFVTGQNSIFQGLHGTTLNGGVNWMFHPFYFNNTEGNADDLFFFDSATGVGSGVLFDGTGAIARTVNGGIDWSSTIFPQGMQGIDFPQPGSGFAVGFLGTILHSTDLGVSWAAQTSNTFSDLFDVHFASNAQTGLAVGAGGTILRTTNGGQAGGGFEMLAAVSRKAGFDVDLPLSGQPGIEPRGGGDRHAFKLVLTFNDRIASTGTTTSSCGTVESSVVNRDDPRQLLVSLTGVDCNAQNVEVNLSGLEDDDGETLAPTTVTLGLLLGDVNGDGQVDTTDLQETRLDRGQATDSSNFREDLTTNGRIDTVDINLVKTQRGTMLP